MEWGWLAFFLGVLVGTGLMWAAALVSQLGDKDGDTEERWR